jgi:hypothetical protein
LNSHAISNASDVPILSTALNRKQRLILKNFSIGTSNQTF